MSFVWELFSKLSSDSAETRRQQYDGRRLPILIIPGFMSSGLECRKSTIYPRWSGKRLWLNLKSLGVEQLKFLARRPWDHLQSTWEAALGGRLLRDRRKHRSNNSTTASTKDAEQKAAEAAVVRSRWLKHVMLQEDLKSEVDGVEVRAISGLEGVNYLYPSWATNFVTYVFGPMIEYLIKEGGYTEDVNLQAAPWDWRLPPSELEDRDRYFSKTIAQIEAMYYRNNETPVVLIAHSLGAKAAHYLLNFAKEKKGQVWIDQHIHSYVPVNGTHIGVPKAVKQVVLVDESTMNNFLTFEECVLFGRKTGSAPWMFPTQLPTGAPPIAHVERQGILEIQVKYVLPVLDLIPFRRKQDRPRKYQLQAVLGIESDHSTMRVVSSNFLPISEDNRMDFTTETFCFTTPPDHWSDSHRYTLQFLLREPEWSQAKTAKEFDESLPCGGCLCHCACCLIDVAVFPFTLINEFTLDKSAVMAISEPLSLKDVPLDEPQSFHSVTMTLINIHDTKKLQRDPDRSRRISMDMRLRWSPYDPESPSSKYCSVAETTDPVALDFTNTQSRQSYHSMSGHDLMYKEGMTRYLTAIHDLYERDEYGPYSKSSSEAPPISRVHAIIGTNIPTEVGAFYRQVDTCVSRRNPGIPLYQLDTSGAIRMKADGDAKRHFGIHGHLLQEWPTNDQKTGDGTVPYWCLSAVKQWKDDSKVTVSELEGAAHREILSDPRFLKEVLDFCCPLKERPASSRAIKEEE